MCSTDGSGTLWTSGTGVTCELIADPRRPRGTAEKKQRDAGENS